MFSNSLLTPLLLYVMVTILPSVKGNNSYEKLIILE